MSRLRPLCDSWGFRQTAKGLVLGLLACTTAAVLGFYLPYVPQSVSVALFLLVGLVAMLGPRWLRQGWWVALGLLALLSLVVAQTPLAPRLLASILVDDRPAPADVIVVLSASTQTESLNSHSLQRMVSGLELLEQGWAPAIVFTGEPGHPRNQFHQMAPALMESLGLPTHQVVPFEPIRAGRMNTYWEAQSLRRLADRHGWRRILLVTSPSHSRRSKLLFEQAGLEVRLVPSMATDYDATRPSGVSDRLEMFRQWVYEQTAMAWYRLRGRI